MAQLRFAAANLADIKMGMPARATFLYTSSIITRRPTMAAAR